MKNKYYYLIIVLLLFTIPNHTLAQITPACKLDTIIHDTTAPLIWSPDGTRYILNIQDTAGVYQIYVGYKDSTLPLTCISIKDTTGNCCGIIRHWYQRNKMQAHWHPSGKWIICVVEREWYAELVYTPYPLLLTFLETGWKMDMWATAPDGNHWYQLADSISSNGNGVVGPVFTPDGTKGAWAQLQDSSKPTDKFGLWYMLLSDFTDTGTGPAFTTTKNINPPGARWIEPGNFAPDGKSLLISSDIGMPDAQGMDQFILNIYTDSVINLTNSPKVWDEHGVFSPDGNKIIFMSSYPYRADTNSYKTLSLKTEFMLMDASPKGADSTYYPGLEQLTHFNVAGYVESDTVTGAVAASGVWSNDGTEFFGQGLIAPAYKNWIIRFTGNCGNSATTTPLIEKTITTSITIFPNPATQMLYVKFTQPFQTAATIKVLDMTGRVVVSTNTHVSNGEVVPMDISTLFQGIYFVQVVRSQSSNVVKFIKE